MFNSAQIINTDFKVGILGGGQLGKMLAIAGANWHLPLYALDKSVNYPAGHLVHFFQEGNFKDYDDVMRFGRSMKVLTIEIEHVNTEALLQLESEGVIVHPKPHALITIKDKGLQKAFFQQHNLPSSPFQLWDDQEALESALDSGQLGFPFVQKTRTAGYDGKGVAIIRHQGERNKLLPGPCLTEELVDIDKELAVVVARNAKGELAIYPTVEMAFNPEANLVEFLMCPARITPQQAREAENLARRTIEAFDICGLLAVELFLTKRGDILINEVAPRPHNSGHHTIDSAYTSQFEQHLRGILNLPLGSTQLKQPVGVMVNLLGAPGYQGPARYQGLDACLAMEGVYLHIYGKAETRPFRKMGHATILGNDPETTAARAKMVMKTLRIIS